MKRRTFVTGFIGALCALAGCAGSSPSDSETPASDSAKRPAQSLTQPTAANTEKPTFTPSSVTTSSDDTEEPQFTDMCRTTPVMRGTAIYEGTTFPCDGVEQTTERQTK